MKKENFFLIFFLIFCSVTANGFTDSFLNECLSPQSLVSPSKQINLQERIIKNLVESGRNTYQKKITALMDRLEDYFDDNSDHFKNIRISETIIYNFQKPNEYYYLKTDLGDFVFSRKDKAIYLSEDITNPKKNSAKTFYILPAKSGKVDKTFEFNDKLYRFLLQKFNAHIQPIEGTYYSRINQMFSSKKRYFSFDEQTISDSLYDDVNFVFSLQKKNIKLERRSLVFFSPTEKEIRQSLKRSEILERMFLFNETQKLGISDKVLLISNERESTSYFDPASKFLFINPNMNAILNYTGNASDNPYADKAAYIGHEVFHDFIDSLINRESPLFNLNDKRLNLLRDYFRNCKINRKNSLFLEVMKNYPFYLEIMKTTSSDYMKSAALYHAIGETMAHVISAIIQGKPDSDLDIDITEADIEILKLIGAIPEDGKYVFEKNYITEEDFIKKQKELVRIAA